MGTNVLMSIQWALVAECRDAVYTHGPESMSTRDLIRTAVPEIKPDALDTLLDACSLKQMSLASRARLCSYGLTSVQASKIISMFELARRLETFIEEPKRKVRSPKDVYTFMYPKMREQKKERFVTLYLDTKNQILKEETVAVGSLNASIVHPREVFKSALLESSASVIMIHNHPSGDPSPSREDILVTEKLVEGGKLLGIDVLDHIIIGDGRYVSLKDEGFVR